MMSSSERGFAGGRDKTGRDTRPAGVGMGAVRCCVLVAIGETLPALIWARPRSLSNFCSDRKAKKACDGCLLLAQPSPAHLRIGQIVMAGAGLSCAQLSHFGQLPRVGPGRIRRRSPVTWPPVGGNPPTELRATTLLLDLCRKSPHRVVHGRSVQMVLRRAAVAPGRRWRDRA
jgi:hypothetical protein